MSGAEIFMAIGAVGSLVQAVGSLSGGAQEQSFADHNAAILEQEAQAAEEAAAFEERLHRENVRRHIASQRAAAGASGLVVNEGSPLLAQEESAAEGELDALAIRRSGSVAAARSRGQASLERLRGRQARRSSFFEAGGTLLTGVGRLGRMLE